MLSFCIYYQLVHFRNIAVYFYCVIKIVGFCTVIIEYTAAVWIRDAWNGAVASPLIINNSLSACAYYCICATCINRARNIGSTIQLNAPGFLSLKLCGTLCKISMEAHRIIPHAICVEICCISHQIHRFCISEKIHA